MRELKPRDLVLMNWYLRVYRLRAPLPGVARPKLFAVKVAGTL
jgi:hypothetical protein